MVHSNFERDSPSLPNDIALLKLKDVVNYGKYIRPICLPLEKNKQNLPVNSQEFTVVGWGQTEKGRSNVREIPRKW